MRTPRGQRCRIPPPQTRMGTRNAAGRFEAFIFWSPLESVSASSSPRCRRADLASEERDEEHSPPHRSTACSAIEGMNGSMRPTLGRRWARPFVPPNGCFGRSDPEMTDVLQNSGKQVVSGHCGADQGPSIPNSIATHRLDQTCLCRGQQLREHGEVAVPGGGQAERGAHVDADHMAARREPQLALAGEQHVPRLVLLRLIRACSR